MAVWSLSRWRFSLSTQILAKKNIFIRAHRLLLVWLSFLMVKPPAVIPFYVIRPLYNMR
jgi:hypothetical protein